MVDSASRKVLVNLAVRDLKRSVEFFSKLGFAFDSRLTDERAICMSIGEAAFVMLLDEACFSDFTKNQICDTSTHAEGLFAISCNSRTEVDEMAKTAIAGGGRHSALQESLARHSFHLLRDSDLGDAWLPGSACAHEHAARAEGVRRRPHAQCESEEPPQLYTANRLALERRPSTASR